MSDAIIQQLKQFLVKELFVELPLEEIGADDGLQTVVGLDSICFIELRMLCDDHFGITIDDSEFSPENFRTLSALASLIKRKLSNMEVGHA